MSLHLPRTINLYWRRCSRGFRSLTGTRGIVVDVIGSLRQGRRTCRSCSGCGVCIRAHARSRAHECSYPSSWANNRSRSTTGLSRTGSTIPQVLPMNLVASSDLQWKPTKLHSASIKWVLCRSERDWPIGWHAAGRRFTFHRPSFFQRHQRGSRHRGIKQFGS